MPEGEFIDIDEIILDHARDSFEKEEQHSLEKKFGKLHWDELFTSIDKSRFVIDHREPLHAQDTAIGEYSPRSTVLFNAKYKNTTDSDLSYNISTERHTRTTVSCTLTRGFRFGASFSLGIGPPNISANLGITSELSFGKSVQTTQEKEIRWTVNTNVKVPKKKCTIVELVVKEDEYKGTFTARTYFSGKIYVDIRKGDKDLTRIVIGDLKSVFLKRKLGFEMDAETKSMYFETRGICNCRYGTEQEVVISETPLP